MNIKLNRDHIVFSILTVLVLSLLWGVYDEYKLNNKPVKYGIGYITGYYKGANAPSFYYEYNVSGNNYSSMEFISGNLGQLGGGVLRKKIGEAFIVKFTINDPAISNLILEEPYSKCMGKQPAEGWGEFPKCNE